MVLTVGRDKSDDENERRLLTSKALRMFFDVVKKRVFCRLWRRRAGITSRRGPTSIRFYS